jgi:hypothetical protein
MPPLDFNTCANCRLGAWCLVLLGWMFGMSDLSGFPVFVPARSLRFCEPKCFVFERKIQKWPLESATTKNENQHSKPRIKTAKPNTSSLNHNLPRSSHDNLNGETPV